MQPIPHYYRFDMILTMIMDLIAAMVAMTGRNVSETEAVNVVPRFVDAINHLVAYPSLGLVLLDVQLMLVDLIFQKVVEALLVT